MTQLTTQQLAELLSGIARAQAALVHGIESAMPGTRSTHIVPALHAVARLLDRPEPTLADLPTRILISYMGRVGPDVGTIARDLDRLVGGRSAVVAKSDTVESVAERTTTLDFSANQT